jgi:hypothetical protein
MLVSLLSLLCVFGRCCKSDGQTNIKNVKNIQTIEINISSADWGRIEVTQGAGNRTVVGRIAGSARLKSIDSNPKRSFANFTLYHAPLVLCQWRITKSAGRCSLS